MTEKKLSILLVEDNKAHAELIQRVLEEKGLCETLEICENLADARLSIQSNTPGLIIADLNLPDGKGTHLLELSHENNNYPVILMTSYGDENIAADAIKAGALDYVVKSPEAFIDLPSVINRVMREWQYITAKTDAQQALLLKEHEQDEILNFMINAVITIDQTGMVLSFNKAAETLFGYNTDEIIGQKVNRLMPEPYADKHDDYLQRYLNTGEAHVIGVGIEVEGKRKDKGIFPMRLYVAELPKDTQGKQRFVATCVDLTQIKQQEEQLRRSQKMDALGKLTGGIAHDYNNILGIVLGYAEQIDTHLSDENLIAKFSLRIQHAAERGSRLAKKLLAFSQHKQPDIVVMDINSFLHEQQDMLKKTLTARIKLTLTLENNIWPVELDSGDLEDAIINMSINAQHAMKSGGELTISTSNEQLNKNDVQQLGLCPGDYVLLSITDTGSGMETVTLENIFDPFYSTKGELGTGLGLSQVYGFVERSGGAINVNSEMEHGSCFSLYFPRSKQSIIDKQSSQSDTRQDLAGTETLLVVDDEQDMVDLTVEIFTAEGYRVLTANDGNQALAVLEKESVDLIISDVIMPNMNGYQLAAQVGKHYPDIIFQMVSGFSDERHKGMVDKSLHENMLYKPYRFDILLARVKKLLDEKRNM